MAPPAPERRLLLLLRDLQWERGAEGGLPRRVCRLPGLLRGVCLLCAERGWAPALGFLLCGLGGPMFLLSFRGCPALPSHRLPSFYTARTQTPPEMLWLLLALLWAGALAQNAGAELQVQESVTVQEGLCVSVPCTVSYPRDGWTESNPAYGFWFWEGADIKGPAVATNKPDRQVQKETQGRFLLLGDPGNYSCSLDIRDARRTDHRSYVFRVERGPKLKYSFVHNKLTVRVMALNHTPDILIPGTLESGRPTDLTCSVPWACQRGTPPIFSWTSATHSSLVPTIHNSSVLTLTPRPQDNGATLTCEVTLPGAGVTMRTIQLNVSYSPQNMTVNLFRGNSSAPTVLEGGSSLEVMEGEYLRLVCEADSNPPARLSWTPRNWIQSSPNSGVLELPRVQVGDAGELTCQARNPQGSLHLSVNLLLSTKSGSMAVVVWVAIVEAVVKTLFLLLCLIVLMYHLTKVTRPTQGTEKANAVSS
ncbi:sialic acid-binding Ig-like lectin 13 isoform 1-T4 [Glossophaga mutica]